MNKVIAGAVAGLALGAFSAVSALDLSAGGGAFFTSDFGGGMEGKFSGTMYPISIEGAYDLKTSFIGGGLYGFFDVTYAEISLGFIGAEVRWDESTEVSVMGQTESEKGKDTCGFAGLSLGLLLKYPIAVSDIITVFPAAGIDYQLILWDNVKFLWGDDSPGNWNAPIFKFGAGIDIALGEKIFLRSDLLYGIRLANKVEKDDLENQLKTLPGSFDIKDDKTRLANEVTFKFGIGCKF